MYNHTHLVKRPKVKINRNKKADALVRFCLEEKLIVSNTWFKLPVRCLYTWKSPQDTTENPVRSQIDYIFISTRYKNRMHSVRTYPGADVESDHIPVVTRFCSRLKKLKKTRSKTRSNKPNVLQIESESQIITDKRNNDLRKDPTRERKNYLYREPRQDRKHLEPI